MLRRYDAFRRVRPSRSAPEVLDQPVDQRRDSPAPARWATPSSTDELGAGDGVGHRLGLGGRERRVLGAGDHQHRRGDPRQQRTLVGPRAARRCAPPTRTTRRSSACTVSRTNATTSGRVRNVVGPRNALSTERVSGGRIPPSNSAMRSSSPYSSFCRGPAADAVQFISTALPMRSGWVAANVPPIMPPHELPTKCVRSMPSASRTSTMHCAHSSKVKGAVSFWLSP